MSATETSGEALGGGQDTLHSVNTTMGKAPDIATHSYNPQTLEAKVGESFQANLG